MVFSSMHLHQTRLDFRELNTSDWSKTVAKTFLGALRSVFSVHRLQPHCPSRPRSSQETMCSGHSSHRQLFPGLRTPRFPTLPGQSTVAPSLREQQGFPGVWDHGPKDSPQRGLIPTSFRSAFRTVQAFSGTPPGNSDALEGL